MPLKKERDTRADTEVTMGNSTRGRFDRDDIKEELKDIKSQLLLPLPGGKELPVAEAVFRADAFVRILIDWWVEVASMLRSPGKQIAILIALPVLAGRLKKAKEEAHEHALVAIRCGEGRAANREIDFAGAMASRAGVLMSAVLLPLMLEMMTAAASQ